MYSIGVKEAIFALVWGSFNEFTGLFKVFMHEGREMSDKGGCLFASLDVVFGQQLLKIGQKLVFCPFLEAGSNLSRWQRKQVI